MSELRQVVGSVILWFVAAAVLAVRFVFRDPRFDYRLLVVGVLVPDLVDVWFGGARFLHTLVVSVLVMSVIMLTTRRGGEARRRVLPLAIGMFLHLVFDGAFANTRVFWWPFGGFSFESAPLPVAERGVFNVALEVIGAIALAWIVRRHGLADAARRARLVSEGELTEIE